MTGEFTADREAILRLTIFGQGDKSAYITAVLDTGFTDYLALPLETITFLGLRGVTEMEVLLGDGSRAVMPVFRGDVLWEGERRAVYIHGSDSGPLAGVGLLYGSLVTIEAADGGVVSVTPLPDGQIRR